METGLNLAYVLLLVVAGGLLYIMWRIMKRNQGVIAEENMPAIAGADEMSGGAINPQQFDEPDDEALDEMADVLAAAAEAQGIDYEE